MAQRFCTNCNTEILPRHLNCSKCGLINQEHFDEVLQEVCFNSSAWIPVPVTKEDPLLPDEDFIFETVFDTGKKEFVAANYYRHKPNPEHAKEAQDSWYTLSLPFTNEPGEPAGFKIPLKVPRPEK